MAAPIVNFSSSIDASGALPQLVLTDTSDFSESETTLDTRTWFITRADGSQESIVDAIGEIRYELEKDLALVVKLIINYDPGNESLGYSKTKNILASHTLTTGLYDILKRIITDYKGDCTTDYFKELLEAASLVTVFEEASRTLIATDILGTQKALDFGNSQVEGFKFFG